jgi:hypothetical protein
MAQQHWSEICAMVPVPKGICAPGKVARKTTHLKQAQCHACNMVTVWLLHWMIFPVSGPGPMPHPEMPEELRADYLEARTVLMLSPRGAAALLRVVIDKLLLDLVPDEKDLNSRIGTLVKRGLDQRLQEALDSVRVIGNDSVHPGQMLVTDDPDTVQALMHIVNDIIDETIGKERRMRALYDKLPEAKRAGIDQRDKRAPRST